MGTGTKLGFLRRGAATVALSLCASGSALAQPAPGGAALVDVTDRESRAIGRPNPRPDVPSVSGPAGRSSTLLDNPLLRTGGSLAIVLALIYGLARVAQRCAPGSGLGMARGGSAAPAGILEVLGRYPLGRGQTLLLMRVDNRVLLLAQSTPGFRLRGGRGGSGGPGLSTLCELTSPEEVASVLLKVQTGEQAEAAARFGDLLGRADSRHEGAGVVDLTAGGRSPLRHRLDAIRAGGGAGGGR